VTVRTLHLLGSPVLRQKSPTVPKVDDAVRRLVDDLFETMRAAKGVGLAANQIGVARRVAVVDIGAEDPPPLVLINPVIVERGDEEETAEEGCLSIPEIFGDVTRAVRIVVEALDQDGSRARRRGKRLQGARDSARDRSPRRHSVPRSSQRREARSPAVQVEKKARKRQTGYLKEVTPEPAGEL